MAAHAICRIMLAGAGALLLVSGCSDQAGSVKQHSPQCASKLLTGKVHFNVDFPENGEFFRQGDTVMFLVCSDDPAKLLDANKDISVDNGKNWVQLEYELIDSIGGIVWRIPDTVEYLDASTAGIIKQST